MKRLAAQSAAATAAVNAAADALEETMHKRAVPLAEAIAHLLTQAAAATKGKDNESVRETKRHRKHTKDSRLRHEREQYTVTRRGKLVPLTLFCACRSLLVAPV